MNNSTHIFLPAPFVDQIVSPNDLEEVFIHLISRELGVPAELFAQALTSAYFCEGDPIEHVDRKLGLSSGSYRAAAQRQLARAHVWATR